MKKIVEKVFLCLLVFTLPVLLLSACSDDSSSKSTTDKQEKKETYKVTLDLTSQENMLFSKYDVDVYVDNDLLGTMDHGSQKTFETKLTKGKHELRLQKDDDSSVDGTVELKINGAASFRYSFESKRNQINLTEIKEEASTTSESTTASKDKKENSTLQNAEIVDITPNDLYQLGQQSYEVGKKYHFTGELMNSDLWSVGESGKYTVYVKAEPSSPQVGLMLFTEESETKSWTNGTQVEFVAEVKYYESVDFEHLEIVSAKVISGGVSEEEKAAQEDAAKTQEVESFYQSLQAGVDAVNASSGTTIIDNIERGATDYSFTVNLSSVFLNYSTMEVKALVQELNNQIMTVAVAHNVEHPIIKYKVSGIEIGENRYVMNPYEVKFSKNLN